MISSSVLHSPGLLGILRISVLCRHSMGWILNIKTTTASENHNNIWKLLKTVFTLILLKESMLNFVTISFLSFNPKYGTKKFLFKFHSLQTYFPWLRVDMKNSRFDLIEFHPLPKIPAKVPNEMRYVTILCQWRVLKVIFRKRKIEYFSKPLICTKSPTRVT